MSSGTDLVLLYLLLGVLKLVVIYFCHSAMAPGVGLAWRGHFNDDSRLLVPPRAHGMMKRPLISAISDKVMTRSQMRTDVTSASCF